MESLGRPVAETPSHNWKSPRLLTVAFLVEEVLCDALLYRLPLRRGLLHTGLPLDRHCRFSRLGGGQQSRFGWFVPGWGEVGVNFISFFKILH